MIDLVEYLNGDEAKRNLIQKEAKKELSQNYTIECRSHSVDRTQLQTLLNFLHEYFQLGSNSQLFSQVNEESEISWPNEVSELKDHVMGMYRSLRIAACLIMEILGVSHRGRDYLVAIPSSEKPKFDKKEAKNCFLYFNEDRLVLSNQFSDKPIVLGLVIEDVQL